ncbi:hypothetical protein EYV94_20610 [Puteibacter caeruleilacunae]|nr:hypothetical protein EYV94_20610 [Puteibacter caeruleilacunae]
MGFTESNITLDFPNNKWFRFQDISAYQMLCGHSFKEMDACWFDEENHAFFLIELKDYRSGHIDDTDTANGLIDNLLKKSIDSLQMILANQLSTELGSELGQSIGYNIPQETKLIFLSIVDVNESQSTYLNFIRDRYKNKFKAYERLFHLRSTVITYEKAKEKFSWVS